MTKSDTTFHPGQELLGFRVTSVTAVPGLRAVALTCEHLASGAQVLHLSCDDAENAFSINIPTPPPDDSGMPHILEHMVLAGSKKFPLKEPFFEMVKISMATFINAMTGYDCTYYPVCSNVQRDLFNLADVYLDAVFHPLLTDMTFQREAHHLALADPSQPGGALRRDGIVYSEMKGVFSNPTSILGRLAVRALLPDTCYGCESGGTPAAIPTLTHERLRAFHATCYHPGNAFICLYGNIPTAAYLEFLAPRLAPFTRPANRPPQPTRQPRWSAPRLLHDVYPIGADESSAAKTYLLMNWLCGDAADPLDSARLRILSLLLLGHEAAPLRRALIDARLGVNLVMAGYGAAGREALFHVGLEGAEPDRMDAFRTLVMETLRTQAAGTFTTEQVQAAFQQATYSFLEILPLFPLHTVFRMVGAWMTGCDPLTSLDAAQHYKSVRAAHAADPRLFNRLVGERLLDNRHRLDVLLTPDAACQAQRDADAAADLARVRAGMSDAEVEDIAAKARELARLNSLPNSPAEVASLPQLRARDLPSEPYRLPTTVERLAGKNDLLVNDLPTNDIVYLRLRFDLTGLPAPLWSMLPRYTEALNKFGAAGHDFAAIARRASACTGGIQATLAFDTRIDDATLLPSLTISFKTLADLIGPALDLLGDLLFALDPRDRERMRDVLTQARMNNRNVLVQNGAGTVHVHAGRGLSVGGYLTHCTGGLPQLALTEHWASDTARGQSEVATGIETIRDFLLNRRRVTASLTAPPAACDTVRQRLDDWLARMSHDPVLPAATGFEPGQEPRIEGLAAPLQIAHCAMLLPAPHRSSPDEPLLAVGAHLVSHDFLLPEIRFKGNAYGASFSHQAANGTFALTSFRDPRIAATLDIFRRVADVVRQAEWSTIDIERGIIGVAKRDERPLRPGEATAVALNRHITGDTHALRTTRRQRLLLATPDSVRQALLTALEAGLPRAAVCVMSGRTQLEQANALLDSQALTIENVLQD